MFRLISVMIDTKDCFYVNDCLKLFILHIDKKYFKIPNGVFVEFHALDTDKIKRSGSSFNITLGQTILSIISQYC